MREKVRAIAYRWLTPIWPMTVVGLLVGAVVGYLAAPSLTDASPTATALIRIDQPIDPNQIVTNSVPSLETQQAYLAGEIVYLSSGGFAEAVGNELNASGPVNLLAVQQGQSTLVQLTATEPTAEKATAALDVALKIYIGRVQQLAGERIQAAIDAITSVIVRFRTDAVENADRTGVQLDQKALEDNVRTLEQQRLSLQAQQLRTPGVQIVEPITPQPAQNDPSLLIVGGAMLGGLLALGANLVWRRRSGVIASVADVDRQVSPVRLPVVRLGKRAGTYARSELSRARTLFGQLPAPRTGAILVVGASQYSGTEVVAKLLYMGAIEHVSVTAVNVVEEYANLSAAAVRAKLAELAADEGQTVVIDGGTIASAPQMLAVAESARQVVVVVRIGRDVAAEVGILLHAVRNDDVTVTAICTKGRLASPEGMGRARRKRSDGGRHSVENRSSANHGTPAAIPAPPPPREPQWPVDGSGAWEGQQTSWVAESVSWADQDASAEEPDDQEVPERDRSEADATTESSVPPAATLEESPTVQVPLETRNGKDDHGQQREVSNESLAGQANGQHQVPLPTLENQNDHEHDLEASGEEAHDQGVPQEESPEGDATTESPLPAAATLEESPTVQVSPQTLDDENDQNDHEQGQRADEHDAGQANGQHQVSQTTLNDQDDHRDDLEASRDEVNDQGVPREESPEGDATTESPLPAAATLEESPTVQVPLPKAEDQNDHEQGQRADEQNGGQANGLQLDAPSALPPPPPVRAHSFGSGLRQRLEFRRQQGQAQDDQQAAAHPEADAAGEPGDTTRETLADRTQGESPTVRYLAQARPDQRAE